MELVVLFNRAGFSCKARAMFTSCWMGDEDKDDRASTLTKKDSVKCLSH